MKKLYVVAMTIVATVLPLTTTAQALSAENPTQPTFAEYVASNFINYYTTGGIQEKLYMVTDKPYYSAGDTIYFSAFLVNSVYFNRTTDTRYIYVELVDALGEAVARMRVRGSEGRFYNAISLSPKTTPGRYTLRAYSKWQTNFDNELFYSRQVEIGNYIDDAVHTKITYHFNNSDKVVASVEVTNNLFEPIPHNNVEYSLNINGKTTRHITETDKDGFFRFSFRPSKNMADCIRMNIYANGRKLDRKVQLPSFEDDFSVKFLPEGGNLIAGIQQAVAFKAVGVDGYSVNVSGVVHTKSGKEVCKIGSEHEGMGKFMMTADAEEVYIATLTTDRGVSRSFTLPTALPTGCVLSVKRADNKHAVIQVETTADYPRNQIVAVVQSRGMVSYTIEDLSAPSITIPTDKLRSGIAQVSIVDKTTRKALAQRLFFVRGDVATASIVPSVKKFSPREQILVDFAVKSSKGEAVKGDFVVSVTDADVLKKDNSIDNIFSYMLLNSDLKGHIENPTYYFEADDAQHNEHLDLVMMTHGWRRYDIDNILAGKKPKLRFPFEAEQSITGRVTESAGKNRNTSVMIFRNRKDYLGVHSLNKNSRFHITGVDSPDTTVYLLQALNRDGSSNRVRIKVDPYIYPAMPTICRELFQKETKPSLTEEYMVRSKQSYFEDGGAPIIDIEAVEIIAKRSDSYEYSSSLNEFNTVSGDMTRFTSIYDALQRFRELVVIGNNVYAAKIYMKMSDAELQDLSGSASSRSLSEVVNDDQEVDEDGDNTSDSESGSTATADAPATDVEIPDYDSAEPALYVNGQEMDISIIDAYPMQEVLSVSYLNEMEAMAAGMSSKTGVIILHVKDINAREKFLINSMAEVVVPGYAAPAEFYAPDYSVTNDRSKRDNRTTIMWEPQLQSNSLGDASISFWSADRQSDYRIVIEGITSEGELLHNEYILHSK